MPKITPEQIRIKEQIQIAGNNMRGQILGLMASIDLCVGQTVSTYYCGNDEKKIKLLFSEVMNKNSLERNISLLKTIIKIENEELLKRKGIRKAFSDIQHAIEIRHKMAHSHIDFEAEVKRFKPPLNSVSFTYYDKGVPKKLEITKEKLDELQVQLISANHVLIQIMVSLGVKQIFQ